MKIKSISWKDFQRRDNNAYIRSAEIAVEIDRKNIFGKKYTVGAEVTVYFKYQLGGFINIYSPNKYAEQVKSRDLLAVRDFLHRELDEIIKEMNDELIESSQEENIPDVKVLSVKSDRSIYGGYEAYFQFEDNDIERKMTISIDENKRVEYQTAVMDTLVENITKRYDWEKIVLDKVMEHPDFRLRRIAHGIGVAK